MPPAYQPSIRAEGDRLGSYCAGEAVPSSKARAKGRRWRKEAQWASRARIASVEILFSGSFCSAETFFRKWRTRVGMSSRDGTLSIDFNRATNPPCAYTDYATCPLPPPENRLAQKQADGQIVRLAVLAGEKAYTPRH